MGVDAEFEVRSNKDRKDTLGYDWCSNMRLGQKEGVDIVVKEVKSYHERW